MPLNIGDVFPNLDCHTTIGDLKLYDYLENHWGLFFSHPRDFTPVCTTELARVVDLEPAFRKKHVRMIALSCDSVESHKNWIPDILYCTTQPPNTQFPFPIIDDSKLEIATRLQMIDSVASGSDKPVTVRACFIIDPEKKTRLIISYPHTTGRNFDEILRALDSLQLTYKYDNNVATGADWKNGEEAFVESTLNEGEISEKFPQGVKRERMPSGKSYMIKVKLESPPETQEN